MKNLYYYIYNILWKMYIIIFIIYYEKCCALHVKYTFYIRVYFVYQNPKQLIAIIIVVSIQV